MRFISRDGVICLCAVLAAVFMLCGCGKSAEEAPDPTPEPALSAAEVPAAVPEAAPAHTDTPAVRLGIKTYSPDTEVIDLRLENVSFEVPEGKVAWKMKEGDNENLFVDGKSLTLP